MPNQDSAKILYCSFCGKNQYEVVKLIAGPSVHVCDECVDLCVDIIYDADGNARIKRTIVFEPEHAQAGVSILANFSRIISQKYPGIPVEVTIEQTGMMVSMLIITPSGEEERVLETLEGYGMVLKGEIRPEQFLSDPMQIIELNNKLQLAALEVKMTRDMMEQARLLSSDRISSLENQVAALQSLIGTSLSCIAPPTAVIDALCRYQTTDLELKSAVATLIRAHSRKLQGTDPAVKLALEVVRNKDSSLYSDIKDVTKDVIAGVAVSASSGLLATVIGALPK